MVKCRKASSIDTPQVYEQAIHPKIQMANKQTKKLNLLKTTENWKTNQ